LNLEHFTIIRIKTYEFKNQESNLNMLLQIFLDQKYLPSFLQLYPCISHDFLNIIKKVWLPLPKIRHTLCQLSGVSTCFQVYRPCLHVAHQNRCVNGANFDLNRHKTHVNRSTPFKRANTALFWVGTP